MDSLDRQLLWELHENCRASFQTLSGVLGISANAVKKRVAKLVESGVIYNYTVMLSMEMLNSEVLYGLLYTDGEENPEQFINQVGANPMIHVVGSIASLSGCAYSISAQYIGSKDLASLGRFLRTLDHVTSVELFPLLIPKDHSNLQIMPIRSMESGGDFSRMELKVLRWLVEDPRMAISDIAAKTGLTARRVGRTIEQIMDRGVMLSVRWNLSAGDMDIIVVRIHVDEEKKTMSEVSEWLPTTFPAEFWLPYISADEPLIFAIFMVENMRGAEKIFKQIKQAPFVNSAWISIQFSETKFPWFGELLIKEMIQKAGLYD